MEPIDRSKASEKTSVRELLLYKYFHTMDIRALLTTAGLFACLSAPGNSPRTGFPALHFEYGSTTFIRDSAVYRDHYGVNSPDEVLWIVVEMMQENPGMVIGIIGHIDSTESFFLRLDIARALRVRDMLEDAGITCERLTVFGQGITRWFSHAGCESTARMVHFQLISFELPSVNSFFRWEEHCCRPGSVNAELQFAWSNGWFGASCEMNKDECDKVLTFMSAVPGAVLEVGYHTDNRHTSRYKGGNEELSQKRAQAIVNQLIAKGLAADRLVAKGYGGSRPIMADTTIARMTTAQEKEAAHQTNLRVEFKVIECR